MAQMGGNTDSYIKQQPLSSKYVWSIWREGHNHNSMSFTHSFMIIKFMEILNFVHVGDTVHLQNLPRVSAATITPSLNVTAKTDEPVTMGLLHKKYI